MDSPREGFVAHDMGAGPQQASGIEDGVSMNSGAVSDVANVHPSTHGDQTIDGRPGAIDWQNNHPNRIETAPVFGAGAVNSERLGGR